MNADTKTDATAPSDEQVDVAVEVFRMLADATRVRLLWALLDDELSVGALASSIDKPPTAVSQHLAKLRLARLVQTRREGTQVIYRVESDHVRQLVRDAVLHAEHASGAPAHHRGDPSGTAAAASAMARAARS